jgi:hypothetical protein
MLNQSVIKYVLQHKIFMQTLPQTLEIKKINNSVNH